MDRLWEDAHAEYDLLRAAEVDTSAVEGELACLNRVLDHLMSAGTVDDLAWEVGGRMDHRST